MSIGDTNKEARLIFKQAATGQTFLTETWAAEGFARKRIKEFATLQRLVPAQRGEREFALADNTGMVQVICTIEEA